MIVVRYIFLTLICLYGAFVAWHTQLSSTNYGALKSATLNCLVGYVLFVFLYLAINKKKDIKILAACSIIVFGFVIELFIRTSG